MKISKLLRINLLFYMAVLLLSPPSSYARRLKGDFTEPISGIPYSTFVSSEEYLSAERKVADIFEDVVFSVAGVSVECELSLKNSFLRGLAGLLVLQIPNAETLIHDTISRVLKEEIQLIQRSENIDSFYEDRFREAYDRVKSVFEDKLDFDNAGFMDYESFLACMREGDNGSSNSGLILLGNALIFHPIAVIYSTRPIIIEHESYHLISNGFLNPSLEEPMAWALCHGTYAMPLISKLVESIGSEEKLFQAYMYGSFEPLKGLLSDSTIECLELLEVYTVLASTMFPDLGLTGFKEVERTINGFTAAIIADNNSAPQFRNIILQEIRNLAQEQKP